MNITANGGVEGKVMNNGYFVHLPFNENMLRQDEYVICRNATVIANGNGEYSCWFDNDKTVPIWVDEDNNE